MPRSRKRDSGLTQARIAVGDSIRLSRPRCDFFVDDSATCQYNRVTETKMMEAKFASIKSTRSTRVYRGETMSRGPRGEKRPADAVGCAVMVGRIAAREMSESLSPERVERARAGGQARMAALSDNQRSDIARRAAGARWNTQEASMNKSHCADLAALYERKAAAGLLDAKFLLRSNEDADTEEVCREILSFNRAIEDGRIEPLDFGDLKWREPA